MSTTDCLMHPTPLCDVQDSIGEFEMQILDLLLQMPSEHLLTHLDVVHRTTRGWNNWYCYGVWSLINGTAMVIEQLILLLRKIFFVMFLHFRSATSKLILPVVLR